LWNSFECTEAHQQELHPLCVSCQASLRALSPYPPNYMTSQNFKSGYKNDQ
jgi:hypothetical protein